MLCFSRAGSATRCSCPRLQVAHPARAWKLSFHGELTSVRTVPKRGAKTVSTLRSAMPESCSSLPVPGRIKRIPQGCFSGPFMRNQACVRAVCADPMNVRCSRIATRPSTANAAGWPGPHLLPGDPVATATGAAVPRCANACLAMRTRAPRPHDLVSDAWGPSREGALTPKDHSNTQFRVGEPGSEGSIPSPVLFGRMGSRTARRPSRSCGPLAPAALCGARSGRPAGRSGSGRAGPAPGRARRRSRGSSRGRPPARR